MLGLQLLHPEGDFLGTVEGVVSGGSADQARLGRNGTASVDDGGLYADHRRRVRGEVWECEWYVAEFFGLAIGRSLFYHQPRRVGVWSVCCIAAVWR